MPKGTKGFQRGNQYGKTSFKTRRSYKGESNPFYGKSHSKEVREKIRIFRWDKIKEVAGYGALHSWVKQRLPKPIFCPKCGSNKAIQLSNTGHTYKRNLTDWEWLCGRCHAIKDNRVRHLKDYAKPKRFHSTI